MVLPCPRPMLIKILCFILLKMVVCLPMEQDLQEDELIEQRNMIEKSCFHPCRTDKECSSCQKRCNPRTSTCSSYKEEALDFSEDVEDESDADEECYLYSPCTSDDDCKACNLRCGWWTKACRQTLNLPNFSSGK